MIATFLLLSAPTPKWVAIGISGSELRIFVDRASVTTLGPNRQATVRIGSPRTIAGPIVLAYQHEEFDCERRSWRLLSYEASDSDGRIVRKSLPGAPPSAMVPATGATIGGAVLAAVCGAD